MRFENGRIIDRADLGSQNSSPTPGSGLAHCQWIPKPPSPIGVLAGGSVRLHPGDLQFPLSRSIGIPNGSHLLGVGCSPCPDLGPLVVVPAIPTLTAQTKLALGDVCCEILISRRERSLTTLALLPFGSSRHLGDAVMLPDPPRMISTHFRLPINRLGSVSPSSLHGRVFTELGAFSTGPRDPAPPISQWPGTW